MFHFERIACRRDGRKITKLSKKLAITKKFLLDLVIKRKAVSFQIYVSAQLGFRFFLK